MSIPGTMITLICISDGSHAIQILITQVLLFSSQTPDAYDATLECLRLLGDQLEDDVLEEMRNVFVNVLLSCAFDNEFRSFNFEYLPRLLRDSGQKVRRFVENNVSALPETVEFFIYEPIRQCQELLKLRIACGWDPNLQPDGSWPLGMALLVLSMHKEEGVRQNSISPLWGNVALLIRAGADLHIVRPYLMPSFGIGPYLSATTCAFIFGLREEWFEALRECGYDTEKFMEETIQRGVDLFQLHPGTSSGTSSGVDLADLAPPRKDLDRRSGRVFEEE